jgi:16S rRNA (adenine1518-N6/adenine1519-N6)-dimethyltransferase
MAARLKKSLGQHLLTDATILERIVEVAGVRAGDSVLEIGAGPGNLSALLAAGVGTSGRVVAVEIDTDWRARLEGVAGRFPQLSIAWGDVLALDLPELVGTQARGLCVGNIPYYITAPIIERLIEQRSHFRRMALLMQADVADRIATLRGRDIGPISYYVQYHCEVEVPLRVPASAFQPPPQVESAVLVMTPRDEAPVAGDAGIIFKLIRTAFGNRRKMLRVTLREHLAALEQARIDATKRPEELDLSDFAALARAISR